MSDEEVPTSSLQFRRTISAFSFQSPDPPTLRKIPYKSEHSELPFPKKTRASAKRISSKGKCNYPILLQDYFEPGLDIVFCGINPGLKSVEIGHHFGGPTNHFWSCLYESGLVAERLRPTQDYTLPSKFSIGLTNLVDRPTSQQNELSRVEQLASVAPLLSKIEKHKPRIVCFVGLGTAQIVKSRVLPGKDKDNRSTGYGLQPFKLCYNKSNQEVTETLFFAVASTSGRVVMYQKIHKIEQFKELRILLEKVKKGEVDTNNFYQIPTNL